MRILHSLKHKMEEGQDFSLCGKSAVAEANLRDEYYWKLVADFIGPQTGEGLELEKGSCKNRVMIQVGLLREDNNFPWIAILDWLKRVFPRHHSADFRCLIERGIATTLSLGSDARLSFLESDINFNFVGPICDSIGVERQDLLEMRDFSDRAKLIEVTNGLILELSNFVSREKISPIVLVSWLRNFNSEYCKNGNIQKAYQVLKTEIKRLKTVCCNSETRSNRRNAAVESILQSPFELVRIKEPKPIVKKRIRRDEPTDYERVNIKEEYEAFDIMQSDGPEMNRDDLRAQSSRAAGRRDNEELDDSSGEETSAHGGESMTVLDIAMLTVHKLSTVYGGKTATCKRVSLDLLKNQYALTFKDNPGMVVFEKKLEALREDISLASPVMFLNYNANFLVDVHDAVEQHIVNFEKEIVLSAGEKLGRDKLPKFQNFLNFPESATSRYIHMACDVLSPRTPEKKNYRKCWVAFCEEKNNPSRLATNQSNRFSSFFEAAAGLMHHHKEIPLFFSDLLSLNNDKCPNVILESVAADANDPVIQSLVCVVAIVYCKILGPYWQLLKSEGGYALYSQHLLSLYQRFLDWSKDPSTLLEPEEETDVFLQFPLQEKTYDGVFHFCGQWHTNRDLIRACLKRTIKVVAAATEEHLKDFLPGGKFSQIPSTNLSLQLVSCTFSILMAEYPFSHTYPYKKKRPDKSPKSSLDENLSSDSCLEDGNPSGSSDDSSDDSDSFVLRHKKSARKEAHSPQTRKGYSSKIEKALKVYEEIEENMDRAYIMAQVNRNGGPCKTQQDVDKMMLRFDGKSRAEKREALRCEVVYQKTVLNNLDPHLDMVFNNGTQMALKLKLALPRVKPSYSIVLAPRRTKVKPALQSRPEAATSQ